MKDVKISAKSDIQEIVIFGDRAYMRNYLEITMLPLNSADPIHRAGDTLTILRKLPTGRWVIERDANLLV
jgi:ketosteroid isomerase-like protein